VFSVSSHEAIIGRLEKCRTVFKRFVRKCYKISSISVKDKPNARRYNWAILFLREINTGTWPYRLGSLKFETLKYGHESRGTRNQRKTALAIPSSNCKL
jgi:hypothetical protein